MTNESPTNNTMMKRISTIRPKSSVGFKTIMIILMMGVFSFTAYTHWSTRQTSQKFATLLEKLQQDQLSTSQNFASNQTNLQTNIDTLQKQCHAATIPSTEVSHQWLLLKAQYAIELAQLNAQWSADEATTLALLQQADAFLSAHHDANLIPVRQALARDMMAEKAIPPVDFIGLLSQLDAIQQQVTTCPYHPSKTKPYASTTTPVPSTTPTSWRARVHACLQTLKQFFVVQHHDNPMQPLLTPAYRTLQKEIIRLNLQEAQWAVIQRNHAVYQLTLKQASDNIRRAFGPSNMQAEQLIQQLNQLQNVQIRDIKLVPKESLVALEQVQQSPLSFGVTP